MNLNEVTAYEVIQEKKLTDIRSTGYLLRHIKTGARVMLIENDDENKVFNIAFRTPPKNSTRCPHSGAQRALRLQRISTEGSFCGTGQRLFEHFFECHDLSGQNLLPGGKLQRSGFPEPDACLPGRSFLPEYL